MLREPSVIRGRLLSFLRWHGTIEFIVKNTAFRTFVFLFALASSCAAFAAGGRIDCAALKSKILGEAVHYCVLLPPGYDQTVASPAFRGYPVLYFLHGLGENEQTLFKTGGWDLIEDLREKKKASDFLIVTPEAKGSFYINSADGKIRYSDFFLREFVPYIERKYHARSERSARGITGISMGGYGALHLAFAHPELFSSVSAESAALMTESPQALDAALSAEGSANRLMGKVFGNPINAQHWKENDPLWLARQNLSAVRKLAIYFNCGQDDDFGFEDGAQALDHELSAEKVKHEFHLYPGNHSGRYFLKHLGEVIQFHSDAFAK
ncbi:MAG: alpha/beta hydrolase-fold protein [Terriglobales bacterium]